MIATVIVAVLLVGLGVALVVISRLMDRLAGVGRWADKLADPTRCPYCGRPYEAHDDVLSPHECDREEGF